MATKQIIVQRFSVTSSKSFQDVASRLEAAIGHPDMSVFRREVTSAKTYSEVEKIVNKAIGPSGFMEFTRFDLGEVVHKERDGVHLSYDTMTSFLTSYGSPEAMKVAHDLDSKVEALLTAAAS